jgi:signal recognition particle subunit SRP54
MSDYTISLDQGSKSGYKGNEFLRVFLLSLPCYLIKDVAMFESLSDKFDRALKVLKGHGRITEINVADTLKDVRKALLDADVSYTIAKDFSNRVREKALGMNVLTSVSPGQLMVKIMHDELTELMGSENSDIDIKSKPSVILIAGLQGSGKTTFAAKLAWHLKNKRGKMPLLVACDVYRPAAIEQLKVLGGQVDIPVYSEEDNLNPVKLASNGINHARMTGRDVIIIDTAGRLAIDDVMMQEISDIHKAVKPQETLFVVDAMTGQDAVNTAKAFNEVLDFDGVVLTKMDGDTRGGAALTVKAVVNKPIKFIGVGEKIDALDLFHPKRMADRILGMGDIVTLVEKAQEQFDSEEAVKLQRKLAKNTFDFDDFLKQIRQIKKMGNVKDLMGLIPGMGKALKDIDLDDNAFKSIEAIIQSMTPQERQDPQLINANRRKRIAMGSGTEIQDVNRLIKQFEYTRKMMRTLTAGGARQAMRNLKNVQGMRKR